MRQPTRTVTRLLFRPFGNSSLVPSLLKAAFLWFWATIFVALFAGLIAIPFQVVYDRTPQPTTLNPPGGLVFLFVFGLAEALIVLILGVGTLANLASELYN